jgi:hypothetical protein
VRTMKVGWPDAAAVGNSCNSDRHTWTIVLHRPAVPAPWFLLLSVNSSTLVGNAQLMSTN